MGENRHLALTPSTMWRCTQMMAISEPGSWLPLATKPTTAWSWISQPSVKNKFPGGFLDGSVVKKKKKKNPPDDAEGMGLIPYRGEAHVLRSN